MDDKPRLHTTEASALLGRRPHHARHSFRHLFPLRFFDHELLLAFFCQSVVFEFSVSVGRRLPLGHDPSSFLETMKRGIERAVLHLEKIVSSSLDVLANLMSMGRSIKKSPQDEHVERALEQARPLLCLFCHGRHSTSDIK
jgi:hypothetical protein